MFGAAFLLPVLLLLLQRAGLVSRQQLSRARRYVIVIIFIVAAVITPPDVVSQFLLAIPLLALFEGTMLVMRFNESKAAKRAAKEAQEGDEAPKQLTDEAAE
jgi:sec-independent protein translocase protein TatC